MATCLIDGEWISPNHGEKIDVLNPCDGESYSSIDRAGKNEINKAVLAAQKAQNSHWGKMTATERGRILMKFADLISKNQEEIAQIEARDTGKPISNARGDAAAVARYFEYYGAAADKIHGEQIPYLNGFHVQVIRVPHGVTAHIIPWNYPAQMFGRTLAPALAMGNSCILKPAEDACLSGLKLGQLSIEAGFPPGALNIVTGYGHEAGAALTEHPGINFATFTGSPEVGSLVQQSAAKNLVPCVLELGGKCPQVVFDDANLEKAIPIIMKALTQNAGQTCSAGTRLLIQKNIYEKFSSMVANAFEKTSAGIPDMDLDCGPIINKKQFDRVHKFIEKAKSTNIPLLASGKLAEGISENGFFIPPALFGEVPRDHNLACDEVFGPVLSAMPFEDEKDAIKLANDSEYGLVSGVWTENGSRQMRLAKSIHTGQVFINCYGAGGGVELPFGGMKKSGHGREKGLHALEEFSVTKTIVQFHE